MSRNARKKIIKAIEKKRESKVITYITSDRPGLSTSIQGDIVSLIHEHILAIQETERTKLDLLIYSRGGNSDVPWALVSMFREYSGKGSFSVLIPYRAHSAATVIALGADEIVMDRKAELGPIDVTISSGPYNPVDEQSKQRLPVSVEDVTGYFGLLERMGCERPEEKLQGFLKLSNEVHPLVLGNVNRSLEQTKLVALRLLETRGNPLSEEENRGIVDHLSSKIGSHSHAIHRSEARDRIGLKQIVYADEQALEQDMWELYCEYRRLFSLEEPFQPEQHLVANDLEEHTWPDLNLACVESLARIDTCKKSTKVRRVRQVPPQVNLNVNLAGVQITPLPAGVQPSQVGKMIEELMQRVMPPIINNAAQKSVEQLLKSLPTAGFERIDFNGGWRKED